MNWKQVPLNESVVEAARIVSEAEVVIHFTAEAHGWFRITVLEDLRDSSAERFFARGVEKSDPSMQVIATGSSPEEAAALCLREAGVSLRRARGS